MSIFAPAHSRALVAAVALSLAWVAGGCNACSDDVVAKLVDAGGTVESSRAKTPTEWSGAAIGAEYTAEDGVRTAASSTARVELVNGAFLALDEKTTIRFVYSPEGSGWRLAIETGSAELEVTGERASFDTTIGRAVLSEGTRVRLTSTEGGALTFSVLVGRAEIDSGSGPQSLSAGQSISVTIGSAELTLPPDAAPPPDAAIPDAAVPETIDTEIKGRRVESRGPGDEDWTALPAGRHALAPGTRIRLPRRTSLVALDGDRKASVDGPAEVTVGAEDAWVDASSGGRLKLTTTTQALRARVPGGVVEAHARRGGTSVRADIDGNGTTVIDVGEGQADVEAGGDRSTLIIGERGTLTKAGKLTISGQAPRVADFTVPAGETAIVHDPRGRTAVQIDFAAQCPQGARVEMSSRLSQSAENRSVAEGQGVAKVWAERGSNAYRVRCLVDGVADKSAAASGRIVVRQDSGTARLPRKATRNTVEVDGRRYTILYQNLLPILTFAWTKAPKASSYKLVVSRRDSQDPIEVTSKTPSYTFKGGDIKEGDYQFWFEPNGGGARSKTSQLSIAFDNAVPTASISEPRPGKGWSGKSVRVAGVTLEGWQVQIGGARVATDRQFRFETQVPTPENEQAIAIRLSHPKRGIHYYLRRR